MGRDTWRYDMREKERMKHKEINPIWRAVGCVIIIVLTFGGYLFGDWFMKQNEASGWVSIPESLIKLPFATWLPSGFIVKILVAIVFMVISFGLMSFVYAVLFPIQPGEYDAPPPKPRAGRRD